MSASPVLVWFRLDLRVEDNTALLAAAERRAPVIPLFIWAPEEENPWPPGAASRWWLHQSLKSLQRSLVSRGSRLVLRLGPTLDALKALVAETGAEAIFWNRRYEPAVVARDATIKASLLEQGTDARSFNASLLFEPWTIRAKGTQRPFQMFSAFWKACLNQPDPDAPSSVRGPLTAPGSWPHSLPLRDLRLEPRVDWASGIRAVWEPGEAGARLALERFAKKRLGEYPSARNEPGRLGTSRLSPHLHFGEIGPRTIWHALRNSVEADNSEAVDSYLKELGWREFAYHLLFYFPQTTNEPLRSEFSSFSWRSDQRLLKIWQRGVTGYPLVDAGMRELWAIGWMHNRVRMVTASFLTKHLRINWEEGAYWFWDTLVDADLANNTFGWQWAAGCGADAAPYFRIFNPVRQSERFDANCDYIKRWIPELKQLDLRWMHKPWEAPTSMLEKSKILLGKSYPLPVVDHAKARQEALAAFEQMCIERSAARV